MSSLTIDNIETLTAGDTHVLLSCLPKSWEHTDANNLAVLATHNISSVNFASTGKTVMAFATVFGAADYQTVTPCSNVNSTARSTTMNATCRASDTSYLVSAVEVVSRQYTATTDNGFVDNKNLQKQAWGDF